MYIYLQIAQICSTIANFLLARYRLKRRGLELWEAPMVIVPAVYSVACAVSDILRMVTADTTALRLVNMAEYEWACVWWALSEWVLVQVYVAVQCRRRKALRPSEADGFNVAVVKRTWIVYRVAPALLIAAFFLNPFRGHSYGVLDARNASDLSVGGLLISGFIMSLVSALAIPVAGVNWSYGLPMLAFSLVEMLNTKSKGIATVYTLVGGMQLLSIRGKQGRARRPRRMSMGAKLRRLVGIGTLVGAGIVLLTISVARRFGNTDVGIASAASAAVGRFTQKDVAGTMLEMPIWRKEFSPTYRIGEFESFVPGFIWKNKPINPAYEINALFSTDFTAASPSVYGSLLLICGSVAYWAGLVFTALLIGSLDRLTLHLDGRSIAPQVFWYIFYTEAMLFEGNWIIWTFQTIILLIWRKLLIRPETGYSRSKASAGRRSAATPHIGA